MTMVSLSRTSRFVLPVATLALLVFGLGCASQSSSHQPTPAIQAAQEIPVEELLDVGITIFDPGLPPEGQKVPDDVFPELRKAESRFQAIQLMETIQSTGQWGAVRVLPAGHGTTDLRVSGTILISTGLKMALDIRAVDARGRVWLEERYRAQAHEEVYLGSEVSTRDPFQSLYNEISNDLLQARNKLRAGELQEIRQVSRLQFAANLSPEPFEDYLTTDKKGRTRVKRLPARSDPMMARVDNIRASENLFIDTLDQNFASFYARMEAPYAAWRKYTYEEEKAYKALKRKALTQKILGGLAILGAALADPGSPVASVARDAAMIGGMAAIHSGIATSQEAKIHAEAIRELAASVETELEPIVVEVRGQTLRLSGSAKTQYQEWQQLMREIWAAETGLPVDPNQPGGPTIRSGPDTESFNQLQEQR
jgi:hypothetical protein